MRYVYITVALVFLMTRGTMAEGQTATNQTPSVKGILDSVLAQMPSDPILIDGRLSVRDRGQTILFSYKVQMRLQVDGEALTGSYTLFTSSGTSLEQFRVSRAEGQPPKYEYAVGDPLRPAPPPDVFNTIRDTGVTWSDLALPFLWWRDGSIVGSGSIKGRECFIIDVKPSVAEAKLQIVARVWIDQKYKMLLQAEEHAADGKMLRRLTVQSFKKINDEWMIKDIVVEGPATLLPQGYKSVLTIQDMRSLGKSSATSEPSPSQDTHSTRR